MSETITTPAGHTLVFTEKPGDRIDGTCSHCGMGIEVGPMFGPIPGDILIAEWSKQHLHEPKVKRPRKSRRTT